MKMLNYGNRRQRFTVGIAVTLLFSCGAVALATISQIGHARAIEEVVELNSKMGESMSRGDFSVFEKAMAPEVRINGPDNKVSTGRQIIEQFKKGEIAHSSYERTIEESYVSGDVVVLMGEEVVVMRGSGQAKTGEKVRRRFTNVWRKINGQWQQIARQATNIPN